MNNYYKIDEIVELLEYYKISKLEVVRINKFIDQLINKSYILNKAESVIEQIIEPIIEPIIEGADGVG